ncbi:MAG TPA: hypothetical protein VFX33_13630 [Actinomycetales bacterium]|nr:hypothetical protein [Actinomycetales bacterium]
MRLLLEGPAIEPLLARVTAEHGPGARIVKAERIRTGGVAGFFAREHFEVTIEVDDRDVEVAAQAAAHSAAPQGIDALVAAAEDAERQELPPHRLLSTESAAFAAVLTSLRSAEEPVPEAVNTEAVNTGAVNTEAVPPTVAAVPGGQAMPSAFIQSLGAAGLPSRLLERLGGAAGPVELLDALRSLPTSPALVSRAGYMVVVVGERREALVAGHRVAERLRLPDDAVLFFGAPDHSGESGRERQLSSLDQARQTSAAVRLADLPTVVVVEAPYDDEFMGWSRDVLAALLPDQVIACVDATRKAPDVARWMDAWTPVGVTVDALSVHRAAMSSDPATVLGLELPVLELDGLPGTAATWLALLLNVVHAKDRADATALELSAVSSRLSSGRC